ncbi:BamA/TamA family outer membrane protein [Oscillatoriales cyanobacterium LEGE 11467]|uniref:BamA/TamA family outer membrane protein n=1 Tax=Zarconia navalis LEGE 11467 TaxID=1828826 RepID=A0A928Z8W2_9CYAN|nr:BamA/TamA family outer membrane protein [Zarconia navalis LEGE 11467]
MQGSSVWVATIAASTLLAWSGIAQARTTDAPKPSRGQLKAKIQDRKDEIESKSPVISEPRDLLNSPKSESLAAKPETPIEDIEGAIEPSIEVASDTEDSSKVIPQVPVSEIVTEEDSPQSDVLSVASEDTGLGLDTGSSQADPPILETLPLSEEILSQIPDESQPQVLVAEVEIRGEIEPVPPELENIAYDAIVTAPGRTTTRAQLIEDTNAIYATGFFANVEPLAEETPLGVRVVFVVESNPVVTNVTVRGNEILTQEKVDEFFSDQYGQILNFRDFQDGIDRLNQWYRDAGYVLAQVIDPPPIVEEGTISPPAVAPDGTVTLEVAEGVIEDIQLRFRSEDGEFVDPDGNLIEGRTKPHIVTREMRLKPGDVFNREVLLEDLGRIVRLGLFEDAEFSAEPGTDPRQVVLILNATEGSFGSFNFGGGFSSSTGFFGSVGGEFLNIGGNNQRLGGETQVGTRGTFFDLRFTDPWISGDPYRTSYTINAFRRRSISLVFDGSENGDRREIELDNGDRPRVQRFGGRVNFNRPLSDDPLSRSEWVASLGLEFQNVSIRDGDGDIEPRDEEGNQLAFNDDGTDNLLNLRFAISRDRRNSALQPTSGSFFTLSSDQFIPIDGIFFNRVRGNFNYYIPVQITDFDEGPQALAFNLQAGTIVGELPPYEAFVLGGTNTVRGFEEGDLGTGRTFAQATIEYRFPVFSVVGAALFVDAATTFGSQDSVLGEPGVARRKPGEGIGYGFGIRVQSPIGPIRIDLGWNDEGDNRFHFGLGERF